VRTCVSLCSLAVSLKSQFSISSRKVQVIVKIAKEHPFGLIGLEVDYGFDKFSCLSKL